MAILTDKTAFTAPAVGDLLHIVDISDTTSNPAGTSKKITVQNLVTSPAGFTTGSVLFAGASGEIAEDNANFFYDDTANQLIMGAVTAGPSSQIVTTGAVQFGNSDTIFSQSATVTATAESIGVQPMVISRFSASFPFAQGPNLLQIGGEGTTKTPAQTQSGSIIGGFSCCGVNDLGTVTNNYNTGIKAFASEKFTTIANGTNLQFYTIPIGTTSEVEQMRLSDVGYLGVNEQAPITYGHFASGSSGIAAVSTHGVLIEGEASAALTINTNTSGRAYVNFGDSTDDDEGSIYYQNSTKSMFFKANAQNYFEIESDGTLSSKLTNYETLITADDDIPNKKYVDDADLIAVKTTTAVSSTNYTALITDHSIFVTTGAVDRTITLPTVATSAGLILNIKKIDSGAGNVIVDGNGGETIDDATTQTIVAQYDVITVQCDGSEWWIL